MKESPRLEFSLQAAVFERSKLKLELETGNEMSSFLVQSTNLAFSHFADRLREAEVSVDPYPHYCLENIFPDDYYQLILKNLPTSDSYQNLYDVTTLKLDHFRHRDQRDMSAGWTD